MRSFVWVTTEPDLIQTTRLLFREYETDLGIDLCFQSFEEELANLPGKYSAPHGALLLCFDEGIPVGCGAFRPLEGGFAELKRMYVRASARGTGLGRELAVQLIDRARSQSYSAIRLDSLDRLTAALKLYESLGFREILAYNDTELAGIVYLELAL